MKKLAISLFATLALLSAFSATAKETRLSDATIIQHIIEDSISAYPGNCPCPYNSARNGSRCGKRSAYNRAGGYSPLCFKEDVTQDMVQEYRERSKG
ncbi:hypothetical protein ACIPL1_01050 [Pseudomonas sp. NPDC090202]|uniref:hypothetical protein n=1 Tax=unclassified Pseudomonas TaxID=196821 RepID=UPI0037FA6542